MTGGSAVHSNEADTRCSEGKEKLHFNLDEDRCAQLKSIAKALGCHVIDVFVAFVYAILVRYEGAEKSSSVEVGFATPNEDQTSETTLFLSDEFLQFTDIQLPTDTQGDVASLIQSFKTSLGKVVNAVSPYKTSLPNILIGFNFPREFEKHVALDRFAVRLQANRFKNKDTNLDTYRCTLVYSGEGKSAGLLKMFEGHLLTLVQEVIVSREVGKQMNLFSLPMLTPSEKSFQDHYNDTNRKYSEGKLLMHELFEKKVKMSQDAVAVKCENESLTYAELDQLSDSLAEQILSTAGDNLSNRVVGISVDASVQMVVGLYAIMKAGLAYVPLDPSYPEDRLSYMIENSEASLILAKTDMTDKLKKFSANVLCLDDMLNQVEFDPNHNVIKRNKKVDVRPDDLAYIIYTSGSTGKPKGVMISHRNAVNTILDINDRYNITAKDKLLLVASLSFDLSVYDIFGILAAGGTLVIPVPEIRGVPDPACWIKTMKQESVTFWDSAPAVLSLLVEYLHSEGDVLPQSLRLVILSGDRIPLMLPSHLQEMVPNVQVMSQGGATEGSIWSIYYPVKTVNPAWTTIPYGMPLTNQKYYVLDEFLNPAPTLVTGELYIGGLGVAMGYMNNEKVTSYRFLPSPFKDGGRIYKTGDLGRFHPEGYIEFCGRIDNQVKIRGFRVELSEIESALINQDGVDDALVMKVQEKLVAYVIHDQHAKLNATDLQKHISETLPTYMVPAYIVIMDSFPVTVNGKVNRKKLPPAESTSHRTEGTGPPDETAQSSELKLSNNEQAIASVWSELLNTDIQSIKPRSSFYEVGGDSISAMTIVTQLKKKGLSLTVQQLLSQPTLEQLALVAKPIKKRVGTKQHEREASSPNVELTPAQVWFFEQEFDNINFWNQSFLMIPKVRLEKEKLSNAVHGLVSKHEMLRCKFTKDHLGKWKQTIGNEVSFVFENEDISIDLLNTNIDKLRRSLDISKGNLIAVGLFEIDGEQKIFVTVHHLVVDLVSWRIILEDIESLYTDSATQDTTLSFQRWSSHLQQKAINCRNIKMDDKFCLLHCDFDSGIVPRASSRSVLSTKLPHDITAQLTTTANDAFRTTTVDLLLTTLMLSYNHCLEKSALHIDVEAHGREPLDADIDISRTLGWFMTMFPLKLEVTREQSTEATLESTIKRTKEAIRKIPHKGITFWLLKYLKSLDSISFPSSDVLFNYYGRFDQIQTRSDFWDMDPSYSSGEDEFDESEKLTHKLVVECYIKDELLHLKMFYSTDFHKPNTIQIWLQKWKESLLKTARHCAQNGVQGYTPSDFPLLNLSQGHLDYLLATRLAQLDLKAEQISDMYPCTPMQEGFLFSLLQDPSSYLIQRSCTVNGDLDQNQLHQCVAKVIQRHDALRTRFFVDRLNGCMQIVRKTHDTTWAVEDLSNVTESQAEEREQQYLSQDRKRGFSMSESMIRFCLFVLTKSKHRLIMTVHHSLLDGMSCSILLQEVVQACNNSALPEAPKYREFVQEVMVSRQSAYTSEGFWKEEMQDLPFLGNLRMLSPVTPLRGHEVILESFDVVPNFSAYTEQHEISPAAILCAAWAFIINKYSCDPNDVIFGLIVSGRSSSNIDQINKMVGLTINTLPMRVKIQDHHVTEWVKYVQRKIASITAQEKSFTTDIQKWCGLNPDDKLFETAISYQTAHTEVDQTPHGISITDVYDHEYTEYPLTLDILNTGTSFQVKAIYDTKIIDVLALKQMLMQWKQVIGAIVKSGNSYKVCDLNMLSNEENTIVREFNTPNEFDITFGHVKGVHQLFEDKMKFLPASHKAIESRLGSLTYEEVNNAANFIASQLRVLGVKRESKVGLLLDRSESMPVCMLAVWKAGGAFVAIEDSLPSDRINFILQDSGCTVVVNAANIPLDDIAGRLAHVTVSRSDICDYASRHRENLASLNAWQDLAYVSYTSGSTGRPNGVLIEHGGIINLLLCKPGGLFQVSQKSRVMQFFSASSDKAVGEIFGTLCHGGCLVIADENFAESLKSVDTATLMPSGFGMLDFNDYPNLELIVSTSEPCTQVMVNSWGRDRIVENAYGTAECSIFTNVGRLLPHKRITVGKPLPNTKSYVLDKNLSLLPVNVTGHLYIGGVAVARGYHNRPDLTDSAFIENPFDNGYFYKTGDLARWLDTGEIEIIGRQDSQVHLRGKRIELMEIRSALEQLPEVKQAHVVLQDKQYIIAYVVVSAECDIIDRLKRQLPSFMVPTSVIFVDFLPLTSGNKIDDAALPKFTPTPSHDDSRTPLNDLEFLTLKAYKEVIDPNFTMDDDFFSLGGHSLLAITLKTVLVESLGYEISMTDIMRYTTPAELADQLGRRMLAPRKLQTSTRLIPKSCPSDEAVIKERTSFHQEQMCLLYEVIQDSPVYNVSLILTFRGQLNVESLKQSLIAVTQNHHSFRTAFEIAEDKFVQVVRPVNETAFDFEYHEGEHSEAEAREIIYTEASKPFNLYKLPLARFRLVELNAQEHRMLLLMHHAVTDGASLKIIVDEMSERYHCLSENLNYNVPPQTLEYIDYSIWERSVLETETFEAQLSFWKRQLEYAPSLLDLPLDRPRPAVPSYDGASVFFSIPESVTNKLMSLTYKFGGTMFTALLTVYALLIRIYCQADDIALGAFVSGRHNQGTENIVGYFVNTLPLRVKFNKKQTFNDMLIMIKDLMLDVLNNQDVPFQKILEALSIPRDTAYHPIIQAATILQEGLASRQVSKGLNLNVDSFEQFTAKFDLNLEYLRHPNGQISGQFVYNTDVFNKSTIERMTDHLLYLFDLVTRDCDTPMNHLCMLPPKDLERIMSFNTTGDCTDVRIHRQFEMRADESPEEIAVEEKGRHITYGGLNKAANDLARQLRSLEVTFDVPVALLGERNLELIAAILGTLKADGAFVCIDVSLPQNRIDYMLEDSECHVVVTSQRILNSGILKHFGGHVICLDIEKCTTKYPIRLSSDKDRELQAQSKVTSSNMAYIVYTSGTTGKPKGVMVTHKGVENLIPKMNKALGVRKGRKITQFFNIMFDGAYQEIFMALSSGATLVLRETDYRNTLKSVDFSMMTPTVLASLDPRDFPNLKTVAVLGEILPESVVACWEDHVDLFNEYGPCEVTINCTIGKVNNRSQVTAGKPIENCTTFVLGDDMNLVPIGVKGTIFISGLGVARGYLNRPDLTLQKFVDNPFGEGKLYNSGDVGCWTDDGELVVNGRKDRQVKLRGFRVELGEVEHALATLEGIGNAAVLMKKDILVGYVTPDIGTTKAQELKQKLEETLPRYMIPTVIVPLAKFPMSTAEKVNYRALPEPNLVQQETATTKEKMLIQIWSEVLGISPSKIKPTDSFFYLGGDSISAMKVFTLARKQDLRFTVQQIFQTRNLSQLAAVAKFEKSSIEADQVEISGLIPLTPIQEWFIGLDMMNLNHFNQSALLKPHNILDAQALQKSIDKLVSHHDMLRVKFHFRDDGTVTQEIKSSNDCIKPKLLHKAVSQDQVNDTLHQIQSSLSITDGPVAAFCLLDVKSQGQLLFITVHHVAIDLVSWQILLEDLELLYLGKKLQPKTTSFKAWSEGLSNEYRLTVSTDTWPKWQNTASKTLDHFLYGNKINETGENRTLKLESISLHAETTGKLLSLQGTQGSDLTSVNDVLLTALIVAYHRCTAMTSLAVEQEWFGREPWTEKYDVSRTVGWFTVMYPVTMTIDKNGELEDHLEKTKSILRRVPQGGLPFGVNKYLNKDEDYRFHQSCDVLFNYHGSATQFSQDLTLWDVCMDGEFVFTNRGKDEKLSHSLVIECSVQDECLKSMFIYMHDQRSPFIKELASTWLEIVNSIMSTCKVMQVDKGIDPSNDTLPALNTTQILTDNDTEAIYECTPLQEGFILSLLQDKSSYLVQMAMDIEGKLDVPRFIDAWNVVIRRHQSLRTSFAIETKDHMLRQNVRRQANIQWTKDHWTDPLQQENEYVIKDRNVGFEMKEVMMRFALMKQPDDTYRFIWTTHHSLIDGWSTQLVLREVLLAYHQQELPPPPPPFQTFVEYCKSRNTSAAKTFWGEFFENLHSKFLITGKETVRPKEVSSSNVKNFTKQLEVRTDNLWRFARENSLTISSVVFGAWSIVLDRFCSNGGNDCVFGVVLASRSAEVEGIEDMVGLLINTLPLRITFPTSAGISMLDWLHSVQSRQSSIMEYDYCNLADVVRWSGLPRNQNIMDSLVIFENYPPMHDVENGEIALTNLQAYEKVQFPITIEVAADSDYVSVTCMHDTSRISDDLASEMLDYMNSAIKELLNYDTEKPIVEMDIVKARPGRDVKGVRLDMWNGVGSTSQLKCYIRDQKGRMTPPGIPGKLEFSTSNGEACQTNVVALLHNNGDISVLCKKGNYELEGAVKYVTFETEEGAIALTQKPVSFDVLKEFQKKHLKCIPVHSIEFVHEELINLVTDEVTIDQVSTIQETQRERFVDEFQMTYSQKLLRDIWSQLLEVPRDDIKLDHSFFDLGGTSIKAISMTSLAEKKGLHLNLNDILEYQTLRGISAAAKTQTDNANDILVRLNEGEKDRIPIVCVHASDGGTSSYAYLAGNLNRHPLYAFRLKEDTPFESIEQLSALYVERMVSLDFFANVQPYLLVGYSTGGAVAFEMALQLELKQYPPARLVLLDGTPEFMRRTYHGISSKSEDEIVDVKNFLTKTWDEKGLDKSDLQRALTNFNNTVSQYASYSPTELYHGSTVLVQPASNENNELLMAAISQMPSEDYGLQALCTQPVKIVVVEGDHYSMMRDADGVISHTVVEGLSQ